jgi:K+-transporting ATPase ATPase B chain
METPTLRLFDGQIVTDAVIASFTKLHPRVQLRNPVMFTVYLGSILTTLFWVNSITGGASGGESSSFILGVAIWLWFTVLFANFAEAIAEGHGKAQADTLRKTRRDIQACRVNGLDVSTDEKVRSSLVLGEWVPTSLLQQGDLVAVAAGQVIPVDGEVVHGVASVDESAITGESAPVVRESGGDRSAVTGGTRVISDWLIIRVTALPGQTFLDRMISMVEGAKRQKTPNEIALAILLAALTLLFMVVVGCSPIRPSA